MPGLTYILPLVTAAILALFAALLPTVAQAQCIMGTPGFCSPSPAGVAALTYSVSGPSSGTSGIASANFTVTISTGTFNGAETFTIADGAQGGTITPSVGSPGTSTVTVTPPSGSSFTFTYNAATNGVKTLTFTNGQSWPNPSPLTFTTPPPTTATLNPANASSNITLSNGNLTATTTGGTAYEIAQSTTSHTTGKYYFEVTVVASQGASQVAMGLVNGSFVVFPGYAGLGFDVYSVGAYQSTSGWVENTVSTGATPAILVSHTYGVALDLGAHLLWLRDTAVPASWNAGGSADPATGVGGVSSFILTTCPCFAAVSGFHTAGNVLTANFGTSYAATPPTGYGDW